MNGHLWRAFYLTAHNPVFEGDQSTVDLTTFSHKKYPVLPLLQALSTLEILLLAQLILQSECEDSEDQICSEALLQELFENYDCTPIDIWTALLNLEKKKWVEIFIEMADDSFHFKAMIPQLIKEGIYIDNKWHDLHKLGLYGSRMCLN